MFPLCFQGWASTLAPFTQAPGAVASLPGCLTASPPRCLPQESARYPPAPALLPASVPWTGATRQGQHPAHRAHGHLCRRPWPSVPPFVLPAPSSLPQGRFSSSSRHPTTPSRGWRELGCLARPDTVLCAWDGLGLSTASSVQAAGCSGRWPCWHAPRCQVHARESAQRGQSSTPRLDRQETSAMVRSKRHTCRTHLVCMHKWFCRALCRTPPPPCTTLCDPRCMSAVRAPRHDLGSL